MNKSIYGPGAFAMLLGGALLAGTPAHAAFSCTTAQSETSAPFAQDKFKRVIANTRSLQIQTSKACLDNAELTDFHYDTDNWTLDGRNMQFAFDGGEKGDRAELRGYSFAGNKTGKRFTSKVKVKTGGSYSTGFTIAQIFGQDTSNPILRVQMIGNRKAITNHLWAIYRTGTGSAEVQYKDLGPAPSSFTELVLEYNVDDTITARLGTGPTQVFSTNLDFWTRSDKHTYFKAGCYLQAAGDCRVTYSSLRFDR